jgi:hypothetical protein
MNKFDKRLAFIKTVCVTKKLTGNVKLANEWYIQHATKMELTKAVESFEAWLDETSEMICATIAN